MRRLLFIALLLLLLFLRGDAGHQTTPNTYDGNSNLIATLVSSDGDVIGESDNGMAIIEFEHYQLHKGNHFNGGKITTLSAGQSWVWYLKANANKEIHFTYEVASSNYAEAFMYSGVVFTSTGTAYVPCNNNDYGYGGTSSALTLGTGAVILSSGTLRYPFILGTNTTTPQGRAGSVVPRGHEVMLSTSTYYAIVVTAQNNNTRVAVRPSYYEIQE